MSGLLVRAIETIAVVVVSTSCGRSPLYGGGEGDADAESDSASEVECRAATTAWAQAVLAYEPDRAGAPPVHPDVIDPDEALGPPDWTAIDGYPGVGAVSLGQGGRLELAFGDCPLTNDGTPLADLRVHEVGPAIEAVSIALRATPQSVAYLDDDDRVEDHEPWFRLGEIGGSVNELDLDTLAPGARVSFDAVRFDDDPEQGTGSELAWGADIDAVEVLANDD